MELKAILFDMDGVLVDTEAYYMRGTHRWMCELGYQGKLEDVYCLIGTTTIRTIEMIVEMLDHRYTFDELWDINYRYFKVDHPIPYNDIKKEGLLELLQEAKTRGWKCAVCSSSSKECITTMATSCGIEDYFDYFVSGEEFTHSKPNPEIYLNAAKKLGVDPSECLVIEDSAMGIAAGRNAGMKTIGILDRRFSQKQAHATLLAEGLHDVLDSIKYL